MLIKKICISILILALLFSVNIIGIAVSESKVVTIASQEVGTGPFIIGSTLGDLLRKELPEGSIVNVLPYGASLGGPVLVHQGNADIAFSVNCSTVWAVEGSHFFDEPIPELRGIIGNFSVVYVGALATVDFVEKYEINSIDEIIEKEIPVRIGTKTKGSMGQASAQFFLEAHGLTEEKIESFGGMIVETSVSDIVNLMRDGRLDVWVEHLLNTHPTQSELEQTHEIVPLISNEEAIRSMRELGYGVSIMPAGYWKNQGDDIYAAAAASVFVTREDVDEELIYLVTKIICEKVDDFAAAYAIFKDWDPSEGITRDWVPIPLHPGAERYYEERGWLENR